MWAEWQGLEWQGVKFAETFRGVRCLPRHFAYFTCVYYDIALPVVAFTKLALPALAFTTTLRWMALALDGTCGPISGGHQRRPSATISGPEWL